MGRDLRSDSATQAMVAILKAAGAEIPFTEESFRALLAENDVGNIRSFLDRGVNPDLEGFNYNDPDRTALIQAAALLEHGAAVTEDVRAVVRDPRTRSVRLS